MFNLLPYGVYLFRVVAVIFEGPLGNDAASVQGLVNPMNGDSVNLHPVGHGSLDCVGAPEGRKQ